MCRQQGWGMFPGTFLASRTDSQVARIVAVNGTHRPPDALAPLINVRFVRSGAEGDKQTPNVTKCQWGSHGVICIQMQLYTYGNS